MSFTPARSFSNLSMISIDYSCIKPTIPNLCPSCDWLKLPEFIKVTTSGARLNKGQRQTSKSREKGIVLIKRQLSVCIDFPVLCGVRLELSCSVPETLWGQWLLFQEEGQHLLAGPGFSCHCRRTMQVCRQC